jgi:hypothetical protein
MRSQLSGTARWAAVAALLLGVSACGDDEGAEPATADTAAAEDPEPTTTAGGGNDRASGDDGTPAPEDPVEPDAPEDPGADTATDAGLDQPPGDAADPADPDPDGDADTDRATGTTTTVLPPGEADPVFCGEMEAALEALDALVTEEGEAGPAGDDELRRQAGDLFDGIDPPDEVSGDWELLMEPLTGPPPEPPDPGDDAAMEAFAEQQADYQQAAVRVEAYLRERCQFEAGLTTGG